MTKPKKDPTPPSARMRAGNAIAWHHVRTVVPADWEVTAYSVEDRIGRLEFNTRDGLQGIASWEPCSREPDRQTTMTTFLANNVIGRKHAGSLRVSGIQTAEVGVFLAGWLDDARPCQAIGYDPRSGYLVRWVFEGHSSQAARESVLWPILKGCDFNNDADVCEYNLHGIHGVLPWDYQIEHIVVLPANTMMSFESESSQRKAVFRRWGLAEMIRGELGLEAFYRPILRANSIDVAGCRLCHVSGHEALQVAFNAPREHHSERFMRRRWRDGVAVVWHDRPANRIYAFEQIGPANSSVLDFSSVLPGLAVEPY